MHMLALALAQVLVIGQPVGAGYELKLLYVAYGDAYMPTLTMQARR
jgi:hypothetical protein